MTFDKQKLMKTVYNFLKNSLTVNEINMTLCVTLYMQLSA